MYTSGFIRVLWEEGWIIMLIENVDWQITCQCNRTCKYCFGPSNVGTMEIDEIYQVIDILTRGGVKQIGITGGEPLTHPFISDIISFANKMGLKIYLSTNCDYYSKYSEIIKEKVSIIGLPLDGANQQTHDLHRGNNSYQNIFDAINDICNSNCNLKIKVGTVVTKFNFGELIDIEKLISAYSSKILFWKLYEMISYDRNIYFTEDLKYDFRNLNITLGQYFDAQRIVYDTISKRNKSYFFIKPNGDVFIPELNRGISTETVIGNILKDSFDNLASRFEKHVNIQGYYKEYRYMKSN